jgi:hypothetical protein
MKTLTLQRILSQATTGPLEAIPSTKADGTPDGFSLEALHSTVGSIPESDPPERMQADALLLTHAYNLLPKLVDALSDAIDALPPHRNEKELQTKIRLRATLTEATTVTIPKGWTEPKCPQ